MGSLQSRLVRRFWPHPPRERHDGEQKNIPDRSVPWVLVINSRSRRDYWILVCGCVAGDDGWVNNLLDKDNTPPDEQFEARLRPLYPKLNDDELKEAAENLRRYLALAVQVYNRICTDPKAHKRLNALLRKQRMLRSQNGRTYNSTNSNK